MKLKKGLLGNLKNRALFIMLLPGALWLFIFCYIPMFGVVIAFKDFRISSRDSLQVCSTVLGLAGKISNISLLRKMLGSLLAIRLFITL